MRGWRITFLLSCALHLFLFNLPDFSGKTPAEKITRRSPIALRMIDRSPSLQKLSVKKMGQKPKEPPLKSFLEKIKKVKQKKKSAKPRPLKPKQSKQKKLPVRPAQTTSFTRSAPQAILHTAKQKTKTHKFPHIETTPLPAQQASTQKMLAIESAKTGSFKDLKIIHHLIPVYPVAARREGREGTARIKIQISENGDLGSVKLHQSSGSSDLDNAALKAIRSWRFEPAMQNGIPIRQSAIFPVAFVLN